jgi:purine-nucleoside phosphorylase
MRSRQNDAAELAVRLERAGAGGARIAIVSGSGLGTLGGALREPRAIPFGALPGMPQSAVAGHAGRFLVGDWSGERVLVQEGRVHLYEGWSARAVTLAVRALAVLGVERLVLTNSAGGLHAWWPGGTLMRVVDHVNLQGAAALERGQRGPAHVWDPELGLGLERAAARAGIRLERGVYAGLFGPSYETPSEVRALARLGLDAVGMSTVLEACAGAAAGLRVAGLSCITNPASGLGEAAPCHEDVLRAAHAAAAELARLLETWLVHEARLSGDR